jgi:hypothetical protein
VKLKGLKARADMKGIKKRLGLGLGFIIIPNPNPNSNPNSNPKENFLLKNMGQELSGHFERILRSDLYNDRKETRRLEGEREL